MMRPTWPVRLMTLAASMTLLVGCASSARPAQRTGEPQSAAQDAPPLNSPLAPCGIPSPSPPRKLDTALARDFSGGRVRTGFSLDGGTFRAQPAGPDVRPRVNPSLAFCTLRAGVTAQNFTFAEAAAAHGLSFGLGLITVADSVLRSTPRIDLVGPRPTATLASYHARLAWIAVVRPDVMASCPARTAPTPRSVVPLTRLPGYQIMAIDAETGADGILYIAKTNNLCGYRGYQSAGVAPAVELVSLPWTLIARGPGPKSATISYPHRSCDQPTSETFAETGQPVVMPDEARPGVVSIIVDRTLATCGPATRATVLLRSATLASDLPRHLEHAPVGAEDVSG